MVLAILHRLGGVPEVVKERGVLARQEGDGQPRHECETAQGPHTRGSYILRNRAELTR